MRLEGSISQFLIDRKVRERVAPYLKSWMFQTDCYRALAMTLSTKYHSTNVGKQPVIASIVNDQKNLTDDDIDEIESLFDTFEEPLEEEYVYISGIIEDFIKDRTYWKGTEYLRLGKSEEAQMCFHTAMNFSIEKKEYVNLANKDVILAQIKEDYPEDGKFLKSSLGLINNNTLYKGMRRGDVIAYSAPPGVGKTSILCQEVAALIDQGFKVGYAIIGDNRENDAFLKISANLSGSEISEIIEDPDYYINKYEDLLKNVNSLEYPPGVATVTEILADFKNIKEKEGLDVLVVDYDANIAMEHESMYLSSGIIYAALKAFAQVNSAVVLVAAQPKMEYYDKEIMPLECLSESGKKQHCIDMMVTLNRNPECILVGTVHLAKVRRGCTGVIARVALELSINSIREIGEREYNEIMRQSKLDESLENSEDELGDL